MAIDYPSLPFSLNHLEPQMSQKTLEFHYGKHHKKYVDTGNDLIHGTAYEKLNTEEIMLRSFSHDAGIFHNSAQAWNHSFFWQCLGKGQTPSIELSDVFRQGFGGLDNFQKEFSAQASKCFGSGWTWLVRDINGNLVIRVLANGDNPLIQSEIPILTCDVWEHAYYLDYQNERDAYLNNFWSIVNWDFVEANMHRELPKFVRDQRASGDLTRSEEFENARASHH